MVMSWCKRAHIPQWLSPAQEVESGVHTVLARWRVVSSACTSRLRLLQGGLGCPTITITPWEWEGVLRT